MAQIPKGRLVKGPYKPICRGCAIYFSVTVPNWVHQRSHDVKTYYNVQLDNTIEKEPSSSIQGNWWFQSFFCFHPDPWGNDPISHIFSIGLKPPTIKVCNTSCAV